MSDILFDHIAAHVLRREGETDDTACIRAALDSGVACYLQAGMGSGPGGDWLLDQTAGDGSDSVLRAGAIVFGDGMGRTIVRPLTDSGYAFSAVSASADLEDNLRGILLRDMTLYGRIEESGFAEHIHLVSLNGVTDALVERVEFKGMRGDGLMIGSGIVPDTERHNVNVIVRDCLFDGITNNNRQGISVIDVDGMLIDNCGFRRCTRNGLYSYVTGGYDVMDPAEGPGMPGPIDFEPDHDYSIIRDVTVNGCRFENNSGRVGQVAVVIPTAVPVAQGVRIVGNTFNDYDGAGWDIFAAMYRVPDADDPNSAIVIDGNRGNGGLAPFGLFGVKGVTITDTNVWENYPNAALIGFSDANNDVRDIECRARLILVGSATDATGLLVSKAVNVTLRNMVLDRCGQASAAAAAIVFHSGATSDRVVIDGIRVIGASGQTAAILATGHTFTPANNLARDNNLGGLTSAFVATGPGQILPTAALTWDPANLADGAGATSSAITVAGAAFGDRVDVAAPYDLQGITCTAYVSAANAVSIRLQNESGGAINLASGSWKAVVTKMA